MIMMTMMSHERVYDTSRIDSTNIRSIGNVHRFIGCNCDSFGMSQFCMDGRTFIAAMALVTWNTSLAASNNGFDINAGILDLVQREGLQYLMFLRVADVQVSVSR